MSKMPLVAKIVLPLLRGHSDLENSLCTGTLSTDWSELTIGTWGEDIDYRKFPHINIRRLGGIRHPDKPNLFSKPVIEMTAYTDVGEPETEQLYEDALEELFAAKKAQTQTEWGYLHSVKETLGATQFSSLYQDSWRVQGLIQLGIRPPRSA